MIDKNYSHFNSGDAVKACRQYDPPLQFVFIGRNTLREDIAPVP